MIMRLDIVLIELFLHRIQAPEFAVEKDDIILLCLSAHLQSVCERLVQIIAEAAVIIAVATVPDRDLFVFLDLAAVNIECAALKEIMLHFVCTVFTSCVEGHAFLRECG